MPQTGWLKQNLIYYYFFKCIVCCYFFKLLLLSFLNFFGHATACRIFLQPGAEPMPPAVEAQGLNHCAARGVPTIKMYIPTLWRLEVQDQGAHRVGLAPVLLVLSSASVCTWSSLWAHLCPNPLSLYGLLSHRVRALPKGPHFKQIISRKSLSPNTILLRGTRG